MRLPANLDDPLTKSQAKAYDAVCFTVKMMCQEYPNDDLPRLQFK
jgi:hypothetical protein